MKLALWLTFILLMFILWLFWLSGGRAWGFEVTVHEERPTVVIPVKMMGSENYKMDILYIEQE